MSVFEIKLDDHRILFGLSALGEQGFLLLGFKDVSPILSDILVILVRVWFSNCLVYSIDIVWFIPSLSLCVVSI